MTLRSTVKSIINLSRAAMVSFGDRPRFVCPICNHRGIFIDANAATGTRKHAVCPRCGSAERHRLQWLVLNGLPEREAFRSMRCLHFAPEAFFSWRFKAMFADYKTADLSGVRVDFKADITNLPFPDKSFDFVYASHVLEHVKDDSKALSEIRRVLSDDGIAILPVPVFEGSTVEYPAPNPFEHDHVRLPGLDFYDRYKTAFPRLDKYSSSDFPEHFQTFIYEDRSKWPVPELPLR